MAKKRESTPLVQLAKFEASLVNATSLPRCTVLRGPEMWFHDRAIGALVEREGETVTRGELLEEVWGLRPETRTRVEALLNRRNELSSQFDSNITNASRTLDFSAEELAGFFGIYLAATNLLEIAVLLWITPRLIQRFGVSSIPTLILFHNGEEIERRVGPEGLAPLRERALSLVP